MGPNPLTPPMHTQVVHTPMPTVEAVQSHAPDLQTIMDVLAFLLRSTGHACGCPMRWKAATGTECTCGYDHLAKRVGID